MDVKHRVIVDRNAAYWTVVLDGDVIASFSDHESADLYASGVRYALSLTEKYGR